MSNIHYDSHETTEKVSKPFLKNWFVWVGAIGVLLIIVSTIFLGYKILFQIPTEKQVDLEIEFKKIVPLKGAVPVAYRAYHKPVLALVTTNYSTDVAEADIFKYYDEQLKQHNWQFIEKKTVKEWGEDLGGKSASYCKGRFAATLQYAGEQANDGWTYAFSMSWGLGDC